MAESAIRFAFAADPHVQSPQTRDWLIQDLAQIRDVDFIVLGGDLTGSGTPAELRWYHEAIATASAPVHSVFGGHDGNALLAAGAPDPTLDFRQHVGPLWYGFDAGPARGLAYVPALDYHTPKERDYLSPEMREKQAHWLEEEIAALSPDRPLLVFQHMPTTAPLPPPLRAHKPLAVLSGHWHLFRAFHEDDTLWVSVPPLTITGFTGMPRGFLRCRLARVHQHCAQYMLATSYEPLPAPVARKRAGLPADRQPPAPPASASRLAACGSATEDADEWPDIHGGPRGRVRGCRRSPTGGSPGQTFQVAWSRELRGSTLLNSPVISQARVVIATPDRTGIGGWVACLAAQDGTMLWERALGAAVHHTPVVLKGLVFLLSVDGRVAALDMEAGNLRWTADLDAGTERWVGHGLAGRGSRLYLRTPRRVAALEASDGRLVWETPFTHTDWMQACGIPLICAEPHGRLIVPAVLGDGVSCFDLATGKLLWNTRGKPALQRIVGGLGFSAEQQLVIAPAFRARTDREHVCTDEGRGDPFLGTLVALSVQDGLVAWEREIGAHNYTAPVVAGEHVLLSDTVTGELLALHVATGQDKWRFRTGPALQCLAPDRRDGPSLLSTPAVGAGVIYIGAADGYLYAIDLHSGAEIARIGLGAAIASSPAIFGNAVFIATCDGALYGLSCRMLRDATMEHTGHLCAGELFGRLLPCCPVVLSERAKGLRSGSSLPGGP